MGILHTRGFLFPLFPPLFSRPRGPGSPAFCSPDLQRPDSRACDCHLVQAEQGCHGDLVVAQAACVIEAKVSGVNPLSHGPQTFALLRSEGDSGRWEGRLLKLPEPRQAREDLHDVQQLLVLELIVLKAAGRPRPSALEWGPLDAPVGKGQAWPPSWGRHHIRSQKEWVTCSTVFNRSSWEERPSAGLDAVPIQSLWGVPAWWPQGPSGWTMKAS